MQKVNFDQYQSPFSWRYGSREMRFIWGESYKRQLWRRIWYALAKVQSAYGLVNSEQLADIESHLEDVNIDRALEIETQIHHDLMAELKTFAEQCKIGGGVLHLGATSMDVEDNADVIRQSNAMDIIIEKLSRLLLILCEKIEGWAEIPVMAFTHLQPAEPTTLGYRFSFYAQDLLEDWLSLREIRSSLKGKGFKGAVGTAASYADLIGKENLDRFEEQLSHELGIPFFAITTQTYPRKQDYRVLSALASLGLSLYKLAFDIRLLQSPPFGEWAEPFGDKQVGSSAMPFKRNPILSEKLDSLARMLAGMPEVAWQNAAHSLLERTLDDSANRRSLLPEAFLITDEILTTANKVISGLRINEYTIRRNLDIYAPFACTERLLMALGKAGADRQEMHERLRKHSLEVWEEIRSGKPNRLAERLRDDEYIGSFLSPNQIDTLFSADDYTGIAVQASRELVRMIRNCLNGYS